MPTITYKTSVGEIYEDIPLGRDYKVQRQTDDIVIARAVAIDLPLQVAIQVLPDGAWRWWYTRPTDSNNVYWHFANISSEQPEHICTDGQRTFLDALRHREVSVYGMAGGLGQPVIRWAFGDREAEIAKAYHT